MPKLIDTLKESAKTLAMYGANGGPTENFGRQCWLARRFAEAGVRFIEITHGNWDQHFNLSTDHAPRAEECDKPIAGLLQDLKQRDMLKDTLVILGGEFGSMFCCSEFGIPAMNYVSLSIEKHCVITTSVANSRGLLLSNSQPDMQSLVTKHQRQS